MYGPDSSFQIFDIGQLSARRARSREAASQTRYDEMSPLPIAVASFYDPSPNSMAPSTAAVAPAVSPDLLEAPGGDRGGRPPLDGPEDATAPRAQVEFDEWTDGGARPDRRYDSGRDALPCVISSAKRAIDDRDPHSLDAALANLGPEDLGAAFSSLRDGSLLHHALELRRLDAVHALVAAGAPILEPRNAEGVVPLVLAMRRAPEAVDFMLRASQTGKSTRKGPPNKNNQQQQQGCASFADAHGRTLLHHAVWAEAHERAWWRLPIVESLQEWGVPPGAVDAFGFTPAGWARENYAALGDEATSIIAFLERAHGAGARGRGAAVVPVERRDAPRLPHDRQQQQSTVRHSADGGGGGNDDSGGGPSSFRQLVQAPWLRLLVVLLLILLHSLQYCADKTMRADLRRTMSFPFAFDVINMVGFRWPQHSTSMLIAKLMCILVGGGGTCLLSYLLVYRGLLRAILRLAIFGAPLPQSASAAAPEAERGALPFGVLATFTGVYLGGLVYNVILTREFGTEEREKFGMVADISLDHEGALIGFSTATLLLDVVIFFVVLDTMVQQAAQCHFAPSCFSRLGAAAVRHLWRFAFWVFLLLISAVVGIALTVLWREGFVGVGTDAGTATPPLPTSNAAQRLAITSLATLLIVVVMAQEWSLPSLHTDDSVHLPGLCVGANSAWLLWFLGAVLLLLDGRLAHAQLVAYVVEEPLGRHTERLLLAAAALPLAIAVVLLLCVLASTSAWWTSASSTVNRVVPFPQKDAVAASARDGGVLQTGEMPTASSSSFVPASRGVWRAAYDDDSFAVAQALDADPELVRRRGGPGLAVRAAAKSAVVSDPPDERRAAMLLHYAVAGHATRVVELLLRRGACTRDRCQDGFWTVMELAELLDFPLARSTPCK